MRVGLALALARGPHVHVSGSADSPDTPAATKSAQVALLSVLSPPTVPTLVSPVRVTGQGEKSHCFDNSQRRKSHLGSFPHSLDESDT